MKRKHDIPRTYRLDSETNDLLGQIKAAERLPEAYIIRRLIWQEAERRGLTPGTPTTTATTTAQ